MIDTQVAVAALANAREALRIAVAVAESTANPRLRKSAWNDVEQAERNRDFARAAVEMAVRSAADGTMTEAEIQQAVRAL